MEERNEIKNHQMKGITFLIIGIFVGIILCTSFILLQQRVFGEKIKDNEKITHVEQPVQPVIQETKPETPKRKSITIKDTVYVTDTLALPADSLLLTEENSDVEYESDNFYIDETGFTEQDVISEEKMLAQRKVKVSYRKDDEVLSPQDTEAITLFNVEQWQSFIKNKVSYQMTDNVLKIKGLDISNVNIYYINGNYYLESDKNLYPIKEQPEYHKLSLTDTVQL